MTSLKSKPYYYKAFDRFTNETYQLDQRTLNHILELVEFYHDSTYWLPDDETVCVNCIKDNRHTTKRSVPVNHIVLASN